MKNRILLVEDSPTQCRQISIILEDAGYELISAGTGSQAIELSLTMAPDIILLDVMLPDLDGFTVCRRMRQQAISHVPILMLTGRNRLEDKIDGLEVGADDYLTKPFDERELLARVAALMRTKQLIDELQSRLERGVQSYQVLRRIALTDHLTGLYNRHYFAEMLEREFELYRRYGRPLACTMSDIDYFRQVNNTFGHPVGDLVLQGVARLMQEELRQSDLIARYGGEEFFLIHPNTSAEEAAIIAERLRLAVNFHAWHTERGQVKVTVSFGVTALPECKAKTCEELLGCADQALYRAKELGRDRVEVFHPL